MNTRTRNIFVAAVLFLSLGCSLSGGPSQPTAAPVATQAAALPTATEPPAAPATRAAPRLATRMPTQPPAPTAPPASLRSQFDVDVAYFSKVITGLYHMYGKSLDSLVDITITNNSPTTAHLRISSEIVEFTDQAINTMLLPPGETWMVQQNPVFLPDAIDLLMNQRPATLLVDVHYVSAEGETELYHGTNEVLLFARRDFPIVLYPDRPMFFIAQYYAAWVTPGDPEIEDLLRTAADFHPEGVLRSGYNADDPNDASGDVFGRLEAIWNALEQDYQVTFVSTYVSFAPGAQQRVRLPGEVLEQASGNCIELSLMLASAAEAIRLKPSIHIMPGHAYLGIRTGENSSTSYFIETTLIGQATLADAIEAGNQKFNENKDRTGGEGYYSVDIEEAREVGIVPMPWR